MDPGYNLKIRQLVRSLQGQAGCIYYFPDQDQILTWLFQPLFDT